VQNIPDVWGILQHSVILHRQITRKRKQEGIISFELSQSEALSEKIKFKQSTNETF
jgi:hypothetical protein